MKILVSPQTFGLQYCCAIFVTSSFKRVDPLVNRFPVWERKLKIICSPSMGACSLWQVSWWSGQVA